VEKNAVDHAALLTRGGGMGDQFTTARSDLIERCATGADIEIRGNGSAQ
jgi:hypothetical protein